MVDTEDQKVVGSNPQASQQPLNLGCHNDKEIIIKWIGIFCSGKNT